MNYSAYLARRLRLGREGRKSSPAIKVAISAVALSVGVMLAAIAVVIGFKREIRDKVIGFNSHITIYNAPADREAENLLTLTPSLKKILDDNPHISDYSLEVSMPAILKTPDNFKGIYLRSLNGSQTLDFIRHNLEEGSIPDYSQSGNELKIVISRTAARELGLKLGSKIDTYFITDNVRVRRMEVAGIYNSHFDSYDKVICYGSMGLVQQLAGIGPTQGSSIQVRTDNFDNVPQLTSDLQNDLFRGLMDGNLFKEYRVDNALNQGAGYFQWLSLLDTNVIVILTLMTLVAIATLISGMLILILDKKRFIGTIRAMGASISGVRRVFIYLAIRVGLIGMAIGNVVMIAILYAQDKFHLLPLDAEAYYIDFVPVEVNIESIVILNLCVMLVIYLSLILPSRFVAKISPTQALTEE